MSDGKMELLRSFESALIGRLADSQISEVSEVLVKCMADFDIEKSCRELAVYESANDKILKQYCACLFVDGKSEKTIYQYRRSCQKLAESIGKTFTEMGVYDIRFFLACEKDRGVSSRSVENTRANLSAFFQWMTKEDFIPKNPCMNINPIKYDDVVRKPFSDVEIDQLRGACRTLKERAIIELLLSSGIRVSELSDMKKSDINTSDLSVHVKCGKGGKGRVTYTTSVAMKHLLAYWNDRTEKDGDMAFYNQKHEALNPGGVRHILCKLAERAEVNNVHPHRFRRTFATGLASRGMDIQEIKTLLGHSSINTTMEYVYISDTKVSASYKKYIA